MPRFKDVGWALPSVEQNPHQAKDWATARMAVLMDLRDQAQEQTHLQREQLAVLKRLDRRMQQIAKLPPGRAKP